LWGLFLQGELQERAYRGSLSEACGVLGALVVKVWVAFFTGRAAAEMIELAARDGLWCWDALNVNNKKTVSFYLFMI